VGIDFKPWNEKVMEEFRANDGRVEEFGDAPLVILHTTGAKSGAPRTNPLMYLPEDDKVVIFASRAGEPKNPDWYYNVKANPEVTLEFGSGTKPGVATEVTGAERDRLYAEQARRFPQFADYERKTTRTIPVVVVTPAG